MLVMTAKVDKKKAIVVIAAAAVVLLLLILLLGGGNAEPTAATGVANNDGRIAFLKGFGWDVTTTPVESGLVRIPVESSEVFDRYNTLQKSQGYDLNNFAGKQVMRYVYRVNNYSGATEPVYATLLIYKNQVIGGDITDTSAKGVLQGFRKTDAISGNASTASTQPIDPAD